MHKLLKGNQANDSSKVASQEGPTQDPQQTLQIQGLKPVTNAPTKIKWKQDNPM
jgi:hypothetical protein